MYSPTYLDPIRIFWFASFLKLKSMIRCFIAGTLCVLFSIGKTSAQPPVQSQTEQQFKPELFVRLPEKLACDFNALKKIFSYNINDKISLRLNEHLLLAGIITDKVERSSGVTSVNVKVDNFTGALFNLSLFNNPDGSQSISGRIVHPRFRDALILKNQNNQYYFTRQDQRRVIAE
jgi:hypothetical protein